MPDHRTATPAATVLHTCDICSQAIVQGEKFSDDGSEIAHTACVGQWFRSQWGRETLHA
jgi:hypothetical protein